MVPVVGLIAGSEVFPYTGRTKHRPANAYREVKSTWGKVQNYLTKIKEAVSPVVINALKNLKPPATAFFNAVNREMMQRKPESKPDTAAVANPAPAPAAKGAKMGPVMGAIRNVVKSIFMPFDDELQFNASSGHPDEPSKNYWERHFEELNMG